MSKECPENVFFHPPHLLHVVNILYVYTKIANKSWNIYENRLSKIYLNVLAHIIDLRVVNSKSWILFIFLFLTGVFDVR